MPAPADPISFSERLISNTEATLVRRTAKCDVDMAGQGHGPGPDRRLCARSSDVACTAQVCSQYGDATGYRYLGTSSESEKCECAAGTMNS
jgi:hypothetical protein